jgi:hypothetical protein
MQRVKEATFVGNLYLENINSTLKIRVIESTALSLSKKIKQNTMNVKYISHLQSLIE